MRKLVLYSTLGCHLCEQALAVVSPLMQELQFCLNTCDIAESEALVEVYGTRIPVIQDLDSKAELSWPFDHHHFVEWIDGLPTR